MNNLKRAQTLQRLEFQNGGCKWMDDRGSGAGLILISPEGHRMHCALRFGFKASNNEAEYEALIVGLELGKEMKVKSLEIFNDS